ncbi:MAG TPA: hypothetical protein VFF39_07095 [Verrucomicrobiae bacterium]|nr:hypothetical protein [Verrucomicrobiae bacterium]
MDRFGQNSEIAVGKALIPGGVAGGVAGGIAAIICLVLFVTGFLVDMPELSYFLVGAVAAGGAVATILHFSRR